MMFVICTIFINREQVREIVKILGRVNALDFIIDVAEEHGVNDIKQLMEIKP